MSRYRDPKTGEVFEGVQSAFCKFCNSISYDDCLMGRCEIGKTGFRCRQDKCWSWVQQNEKEAVDRMGYEVIDDTPTEEDNMDKQDKPRLADVLGVEVGEKFHIKGRSKGVRDVTFWILENGVCCTEPENAPYFPFAVLDAINHPENIIRGPRLTDPEIAIIRAVGAKWAKWSSGSSYVVLYELEETDPIAYVDHNLFPSVKPGDCIELEDAE